MIDRRREYRIADQKEDGRVVDELWSVVVGLLLGRASSFFDWAGDEVNTKKSGASDPHDN